MLAAVKPVMEVVTPLGKDLLLHRMVAREELGRLSELEIDLLSPRKDIKFPDVLAKNVTVRLELQNNENRYFNGFVTRFSQVGTRGRYHVYHASVRPWLWFLTRTSDCRIFQNMKVPDILTQVFNDHQVADVKFELLASYREWEYCVQYRETDFNFVSRLMEQEGIYYYFKHIHGRHTMVLTDSYEGHAPFAGHEQIPFIPLDRKRPEQEAITDWSFAHEVQAGGYAIDDYNFKAPQVERLSTRQNARQHELADYELYDYPGEFEVAPEGNQYVRTRLEEVQTQFEVAQGTTNCRGLCTGSLFKLKGHPRTDQAREYLVVGATHDLDYSEYESMEGGGTDYGCTFRVIDSREPFRPQRITPKPMVQGPQTAMVVGPHGDEIYTDEHGRVKVQFHWDRYGKSDENSSCWIRVSHPWAGKGWGSISIPRIGQEVIVDFLDGDPDRPIITGRVYNAETMPPYGLPAGKVVSGLKTNSTPGGGGYNEMSMDDTKGKEKITIHGQYDMNTTVQHDQTNTVNHDSTETIKNNAKITITEGTYSHDVATGTATYHVQAALKENYDATHTTTVKDAIKIVSTGGPIDIDSSSQHIHLTAATHIQLEVGASKMKMDSAGKITIEGLDVTITGAASTIKLDATGVAVTAPKISLNG